MQINRQSKAYGDCAGKPLCGVQIVLLLSIKGVYGPPSYVSLFPLKQIVTLLR